jgi:hypothetical protein
MQSVTRRVHIKGVRRKEIDADQIQYVYFQEEKRLVAERRARAEEEARRSGGTSKDRAKETCK